MTPTDSFLLAREHLLGIEDLFAQRDQRALLECYLVSRSFVEATQLLAAPHPLLPTALRLLETWSTAELTPEVQAKASELVSWIALRSLELWKRYPALHPTATLI